MDFVRQIERLQLLNKLVKEQRTGKPEELADRMGISRRQLYSYLEFLKDQGVEINFSRKLNSFIYTCDQNLEIAFRFRVLDMESSRDIQGGENFCSTSSVLFLCTEEC
jgi:predicted DNA-binding transcriptional regulator YafY